MLALFLLLAVQESPLHGSMDLKYRSRWTSGHSDEDLYQYLSLEAGEESVRFSASARLAEDLDGDDDPAGYTPFDSLDDSYSGATARLYTAYVEVGRVLPGISTRLGRWVLDEIPEGVPTDGGLLRFQAEIFDLGAFAGRPVNLFESSSRDDALYGGWAGGAPWRGARLQAEYLHLEDENIFGAFDDDLVGASFEQRAGVLSARGRHTWLEGESRETTARTSVVLPDLGFIADLRADYVHERQHALSYPLDPYAVVMFDLEPYLQGAASLSQRLGAHFALDASATRREFVRDGVESDYNHEFTRWTLAPRADDWPLAGLSISFSADLWDSRGESWWTAGGAVRLRLHPDVTVDAGSGYALYTLDAFTGEERERVRTWSLSLRLRAEAGTFLEARFSVEETDFEDFRGLEVGVRRAF